MAGLLGELGKKLADRWLSLLVLPGALYLAVWMAGTILGQAHALDLGLLTRHITVSIKAPTATTAGGQVVLLASVLAGAAVIGLTAQALGSLVERAFLAADWRGLPSPLRLLVRRRVARRRDRWTDARMTYREDRDRAARAYVRHQHLDPAQRYAAYRKMTRIAVELPDRPTWSGDRMNSVALRLDRDLHLDLASLWPPLWLQLPDSTRNAITDARNGLARASALAGWAALYAPLVLWWWPAAVISTVLTAIAWQRIRVSVEAFALTVEAAVRLYAAELARALGVKGDGPFTPEDGDALTRYLHSDNPRASPEEH
jgi:hypothetical protein